ncbi:MAG: hypothetical protein HT580_09725 [Dechloromonas sp.]|nr:MAG: hypothetical protein HT580_09725 [Dechloromonas sp.]
MRRQAAAIVCGLLLLQGSHGLSAAEKSNKKQNVEKHAAPAKAGGKSAPKGTGSAGAAFGFAELIDQPVGGLSGSASFTAPVSTGGARPAATCSTSRLFPGPATAFRWVVGWRCAASIPTVAPS